MVVKKKYFSVLFVILNLLFVNLPEVSSQEAPREYEFQLQITPTYYVEIPPSYKSCNKADDCVAVEDMCGIPVVVNKYYEQDVKKTVQEAKTSRTCGDESMARVPAPSLKMPDLACDRFKQCVIKPDSQKCMVRDDDGDCFTKCLTLSPSGYCSRNCSKGMKCWK